MFLLGPASSVGEHLLCNSLALTGHRLSPAVCQDFFHAKFISNNAGPHIPKISWHGLATSKNWRTKGELFQHFH